ncbi:hypothetical protein LU699_08635 [Luteimonas fraxinea]|uniref:Lipoprotein n=1 Tax=Luteimonas fraxinea TaxID=2901869 RepID=A0ABS8UDD2_9GAMM|nr:hypothetical protein [Luteimonas fraxinea]MCD9097497.1 hypothetical protein [Luteimonas fraxinea]MCD9124946.1 hypothetical protein [Luteimonas fraxinea]UHH11748.1 hypothetical protein LU699_08635 [Luteimonas fraxinea]
MTSIRMTVVVAALFATGCVSGVSNDQARWLQPAQAIQLAADAAPRGAAGTFSMQVNAIGHQDGATYLNSETDYRDQRNLTVALTPAAARQLELRLGEPLAVALEHKRILVQGAATRVRINFTTAGQPTGKYYYQTHVRVTDAAQIQLQ